MRLNFLSVVGVAFELDARVVYGVFEEVADDHGTSWTLVMDGVR